MLRLCILLVATVTLAMGAPASRRIWNLIYPATAHPEQYVGRATGHFGIKFVPHADMRSFPSPDMSKRIRDMKEDAVIQAALLIGKDGRVKDVAIVAQMPAD